MYDLIKIELKRFYFNYKKNIIPIISFILLLLTIFNYYVSIFDIILSSKVVKFYANYTDSTLFSLFLLPLILLCCIYILFIWVHKKLIHDVYYFSIILLLVPKFDELENIILSNNFIYKNLFNIPIFELTIYISIVLTAIKYLLKWKEIKSRKKKKENFELVCNDSPWSSGCINLREDFNTISHNLFEIIQSHNYDSISISITGKWGSGKSSFIEYTKTLLENAAPFYIYLNFYPWRCNDSKNITYTFFKMLADKIDNIQLKKTILKYVNTLLPEINSKFDLIFKLLKKENQNDLHDSIDSQLENLKTKVIVLIDDLDRLEKDEILSVLRIIRNSAKFKNIIFITAMDKDYIVDQLQLENGYTYLDKFFQFERFIPPMHDSQKKDVFFKLFKTNVQRVTNDQNLKYHKTLEEIILNDQQFFNYFETIREMKLFFNKLQIMIIQQNNIGSILKLMKSYDFRFSDKLELHPKQVILISLLFTKYSNLIKFSNLYIEELLIFLRDKQGSVLVDYFDNGNEEVKHENYKYKEFEHISSDPLKLNLLMQVFINSSEKSLFSNNIDIENFKFIFFDNYFFDLTKGSNVQSKLLIYEFENTILNIDYSNIDYSNIDSFDNVKEIVNVDIFKDYYEDIIFNLILKLKVNESISKRIFILKTINYMLNNSKKMSASIILSNKIFEHIFSYFCSILPHEQVEKSTMYNQDIISDIIIKIFDLLLESDINKYLKSLLLAEIFEYIVDKSNNFNIIPKKIYTHLIPEYFIHTVLVNEEIMTIYKNKTCVRFNFYNVFNELYNNVNDLSNSFKLYIEKSILNNNTSLINKSINIHKSKNIVTQKFIDFFNKEIAYQ